MAVYYIPNKRNQLINNLLTNVISGMFTRDENARKLQQERGLRQQNNDRLVQAVNNLFPTEQIEIPKQAMPRMNYQPQQGAEQSALRNSFNNSFSNAQQRQPGAGLFGQTGIDAQPSALPNAEQHDNRANLLQSAFDEPLNNEGWQQLHSDMQPIRHEYKRDYSKTPSYNEFLGTMADAGVSVGDFTKIAEKLYSDYYKGLSNVEKSRMIADDLSRLDNNTTNIGEAIGNAATAKSYGVDMNPLWSTLLKPDVDNVDMGGHNVQTVYTPLTGKTKITNIGQHSADIDKTNATNMRYLLGRENNRDTNASKERIASEKQKAAAGVKQRDLTAANKAGIVFATRNSLGEGESMDYDTLKNIARRKYPKSTELQEQWIDGVMENAQNEAGFTGMMSPNSYATKEFRESVRRRRAEISDLANQIREAYPGRFDDIDDYSLVVMQQQAQQQK